MHKQSTWHLQFILVTENLIDDKFRKWQIFNIGLNNLSLLILIIGFFFLAWFLLAALFQCSISCQVGKKKPALFVPYGFSLIKLHITRLRIKWRTSACHIPSSCLSPGQRP